MHKKLGDKYDAKLVETERQKEWQKSEEKNGQEFSVYSFRNDLPKDQTFVIDTPPPTVSGLLHMGHVFSYTQADFVARYNRMKGKDVFYPMGFDDNGLPTERLVEKIIGKKAAIYEAENGAGSFVAKCRETVEEAEKEFETLFNEIALSVDWKQKYQTISPESQKISQASFIDLFNKGLAEKRLAPTFWDISDRTALAQADLIDKEVDGAMHEIDFAIEGQGFDNSPLEGQGFDNSPLEGQGFDNSTLEGESKSLSDFGGGSENLAINPSFQINSNNLTPHGSQAATVIATCSPAPPQGGRCPTESGLTATEGLNQSYLTATITIMTTRPELLAACVAVMVHPEDERFKHLIKPDKHKLNAQGEGKTGSFAITPLFGVRVPIIADSLVQMDKGTGAVMCCTFGDETDIKWWRKHKLPLRVILRGDGRFAEILKPGSHKALNGCGFVRSDEVFSFNLSEEEVRNKDKFLKNYIAGIGIKDARKTIVENLVEQKFLNPEKITPIKHNVKCAERSGAPIEIISAQQWFIKILPFKEQLKAQANKCNWYPDYMRIRIEQWIDGLSWDWCISRQRFFGVKFPVWNLFNIDPTASVKVSWHGERDRFDVADPRDLEKTEIADISQLPVDPTNNIPLGYKELNEEEKQKIIAKYAERNLVVNSYKIEKKWVRSQDGKVWALFPETDIMDTWATSSITPQLSSKGISDEVNEFLAIKNQNLVDESKFTSDETTQNENQIQRKLNLTRHQKLFPADMRPQAHEIIRTWAFYTIVKAYFHSLSKEEVRQKLDAHNAELSDSKNKNFFIAEPEFISDEAIQQKTSNSSKLNSNISIPWKNLMISGWCLAADKTKMSKSKGNVVTPTALIQEKSADVVRYWASASNLGADIAYSEEVFKIGQKLITKLFNSAKFCSQHFAILEENVKLNELKIVDNTTINLEPEQLNDNKFANQITQTADLWILGRLQQTIEIYQNQFEVFEYARAREAIEEFFWHDFCDNYLEICKVRSYGLAAEKLVGVDLNDEQKQQILQKQLSAVATLHLCLNNLLKLFAPFIPHITEEIYSTIFVEEFALKGSIHARGNFAKLPQNLNNLERKMAIENALEIGGAALQVIFEVRKFKSQHNLSMKTAIQRLVIEVNGDLSKIGEDLANVCNAQNLEFEGSSSSHKKVEFIKLTAVNL